MDENKRRKKKKPISDAMRKKIDAAVAQISVPVDLKIKEGNLGKVLQWLESLADGRRLSGCVVSSESISLPEHLGDLPTSMVTSDFADQAFDDHEAQAATLIIRRIIEGKTND